MSTAAKLSDKPAQPKWMTWVGWILTLIPCAMLIMSGAMKLNMPAKYLDEFTKSGWPPHLATPLGIVELTCTVLYLIPQTAVLGAVLLTGYMGGAVAHHTRLEEAFVIQVGLGVLVWLGLFFRDARIRAVLPLRR